MKKNLDFEISPDDLVDMLSGTMEKIKEETPCFESLVDLENALDRELFIRDINPGLGTAVDIIIRFWNRYDEAHNIPIEERKPIKIYIDSPGGSLVDSFTVIDSIQMSKTPVWTICTGCAYSGGFFIFIAGHRRYSYPTASFLYHEGSAQNGGTAGQFANFAMFYKKQLQQLKNIVLKFTKIDDEKYREIQKEDFWMLADEALELGVCDEIIEELI